MINSDSWQFKVVLHGSYMVELEIRGLVFIVSFFCLGEKKWVNRRFRFVEIGSEKGGPWT